MKKRILALALAGTTAFSVFGAALSANAAETWPSAQNATWAGTNDAYKPYEPVAKQIYANYYENAASRHVKYYMVNTGVKTFYVNPAGIPDGVPAKTFFNTTEEAEKKLAEVLEAEYVKTVEEKYTHNGYKDTIILDNKSTTGYFGSKYDCFLTSTEDDGFKRHDFADIKALAEALDMKERIFTIEQGDNGKVDALLINGKYYITVKGAIEAYVTRDDLPYYHFDNAGNDLAHATCAAAQKEAQKNWVITPVYSDATPSNAGTDKIVVSASSTDTLTDASTSAYKWYFEGSTSADTTVYPWTTTTKYVPDINGYHTAVDQAEENPTVYLFDFIPANSTTASSSAIATAYNYKTVTDAAALIDADKTNGATTWKAETGYGGSYGIRKEVIDEYEDFLSELILLQRYGDYTVSKANFKAEYEDRYVKGYYYNPYTGLATKYEWKTDLYNIDRLLEDIYASSENNAYSQMNTSELLYLMQQYDKYIGNYVNKAEVEKDAWGDLLVSILENVTEDDFKKSADYKTFKRKAEDAIDAYEDAETSSMIKTAEQAMYNLVVAEQAKTSGAADEKKALNSDLYSLYFNVKKLPGVYTTKYASTDSPALTNYSYIAAVTTVADSVYVNSNTINTIGTTTTGHYSLYPQADYAETGNALNTYVGNAAKYTNLTGTDEYEWFLNVYELAANVNDNSKVVAGVVTAVNDALNEAVEALEVTRPATATAESALDEMIEHYEEVLDFYVTGNGVNEEDFSATYYAPYTAALEYAEVAEGAAQVANARYMVKVAAEALTYNGAQVTVTKNDIKTVTAAITDGKAALKAIKDSKDYNAAQVTALNKAIDQAQDVVDIYNAKYSSSYNKVNHIPTSVVGDKDGIVKSDITGAIDAINAAIDYSEVIMGWSKNDAGKWMYGTDEGYLNNGWNKIASVWYYFNEDGTAKQSEWMQEDGKWYWFNSNAGAAIGWAKVDGQWYYFGGNNAMKTGWQKVDGNWYYLASSGRMITGWAQVDGKWYYMSKESNSLGQMLANTTTPDGYKVGADGAMLTK